MSNKEKFKNSLLGAIRKACLDDILDSLDLINLGCELQRKKADEQCEMVRRICKQIEKDRKPTDPLASFKVEPIGRIVKANWN